MGATPQLSEKLLNEAGGWQAMKQARALYEIGRVLSSHYEPPILRGLVREGETEYRAGLKLSGGSNVENLCGCRASREWGMICAHSLAVGLAVLRVKAPPAEPSVSSRLAGIPAGALQGPFFSADAEGEPAIIHIILPLKIEPGWEKDQLVAGIEAEVGNRRVLIQALDAKKTFRCGPEDIPIIEAVRRIGGGGLAGMLILNKPNFLDLLDAARGHPRVTFGRNVVAKIAVEPLKPRLILSAGDGLRLRVEMPRQGLLLIAGSRRWMFSEETFQEIAPGLSPAYEELLRKEITLAPQDAAAFVAAELPSLARSFELRQEGAPLEAITFVPADPEFSLTLEGSLNHLAARLQGVYSRRVVTLGLSDATEQFSTQDPENPSRFLTRNTPAEAQALARLTRWGFTGPDTTGHFVLKGERHVLEFLARELPHLQREWTVSSGARFKHVTGRIVTIQPRIDFAASGENWFDMSVSLAAPGGERFSAAEIQRLLEMGQSHVRLKNGRLAVFDSGMLDELQNVLLDCAPTQREPGLYRVNRMHAGYLDSILAGQPNLETSGAPPWLSGRVGGNASTAHEMAPVPLGSLESVLRPYQKQGVYWMSFLAANGFGGILADEMGLGKTLQALAFLRALPGTSLVVCPSTLIQNWKREAARFCPELPVLVLEGPERHELLAQAAQEAAEPRPRLLVTSYPLLRRDIDRYRGISLSAVILDEAQHIKNPDTQNAQAATALKADHRFVLTGTPMENSVRDLWSIMHFVLPGYLGARADFRDRYEQPIMKDASTAIQTRLAKRLRPFLLRRLKREVATDLPDKMEQVAYCELTSEQTKVYAELLRQSRSQIDQASGEKSPGKARMLILTALLRLRQACCDLRLLKLDGIDPTQASGKLDLLDELLQEAVDGGHRVLIFSQFVTMLALIKERLAGIPFAYLDGATKDRAGAVDSFQNNPAIPVFLISLKAGGVGLNLTAADTVIHFDPWWNPAVEAQATDRAHRIGQKNVVTSYKLIARGTIEEKILNLQRKKREVIDATVESEEPLMTALTMTEIQDLLA